MIFPHAALEGRGACGIRAAWRGQSHTRRRRWTCVRRKHAAGSLGRRPTAASHPSAGPPDRCVPPVRRPARPLARPPSGLPARPARPPVRRPAWSKTVPEGQFFDERQFWATAARRPVLGHGGPTPSVGPRRPDAQFWATAAACGGTRGWTKTGPPAPSFGPTGWVAARRRRPRGRRRCRSALG
jgi:hypothetical protein